MGGGVSHISIGRTSNLFERNTRFSIRDLSPSTSLPPLRPIGHQSITHTPTIQSITSFRHRHVCVITSSRGPQVVISQFYIATTPPQQKPRRPSTPMRTFALLVFLLLLCSSSVSPQIARQLADNPPDDDDYKTPPRENQPLQVPGAPRRTNTVRAGNAERVAKRLNFDNEHVDHARAPKKGNSAHKTPRSRGKGKPKRPSKKSHGRK